MGNKINLKKILIFSVPLYIIICIIIVIIFLINRNPYAGEQTNINNLESTKETSEVLNIIKYNLYQTIGYNNPSVNPADISDVTIRNGSKTETYDDNSKLHLISLLVDIPSLRQTYQVNYQWADSEDITLEEWKTNVSCPTKDQLIYEPFNCEDMFTKMAGTNDPIINLFPYYGSRFEITASTSDNKITSLNIKLLTCIDSSLPTYQSEAENWLKEKGVDLEKYQLNITSCS